MPRFSVAFSRRKSPADDAQNALVAPPPGQHSFRVIERQDFAHTKSFDGGARLARASGAPIPRPNHADLEVDDNMFAGLNNNNRGSGASNTTKATSTDTSSRHSNASTAPSSADMGAHGHDDSRNGAKTSTADAAGRGNAAKATASSLLNRAGRTFSFGGQKKNSAPVPQDDDLPDVPPIPTVPTIERQDPTGRSRGLTASTTSTATPPKLEEGGAGLDMGGDFGTMFTGFDKRASTATLRNTGSPQRSSPVNRQGVPASLSLDNSTSVEPAPSSWNSGSTDDNLLESRNSSGTSRPPPPVPAHQPRAEFKPASVPSETVEDEDARLLHESLSVAGRFLNGYEDAPRPPPYGRHRSQQDSFSSLSRKPVGGSFGKQDDNMFEGSLSGLTRVAQRYTSRPVSPPRNKVMTPAQFERYRMDKERQEMPDIYAKVPVKDDDDDDDDEINYDDEEDEAEKSRQQARQRRKQEAHMTVYRQQMMKVTGEPASPAPSLLSRPSLPLSLSAPQLGQLGQKTPSPDPHTGASDEEDDEEVPLAILQAHGFPSKNRPPTRLSTMGSNPNLRLSVVPPTRAGSAMGTESPASSSAPQRQSTLPAFARNLPQDPFVGAGIARPAVRESLSYGGGMPASPSQSPLPPGGLVGVIASEERSRAMRRGSPNIDNSKLIGGANNPQGPGFDPMAGIPPQAMYPGGGPGGMGGMGGMPMMPQQMLTPGDQAQIQMTQQMSHFMNMQMQFMQMMASQNPNGAMPPMSPMSPMMQQPYGGNTQASQSVADLSMRQSMVGDPMAEPRRLQPGMRTMSMVQPSSSSFMQQPFTPSIHLSGPGYSPSIAPSERSNVGLPGRYRPVSQVPDTMLNHQPRSNSMSGALSQWDDVKRKSTVNVVSNGGAGSDEDDDEGWEAMKAKRDKKRSIWKSKKIFGNDIGAVISSYQAETASDDI